LAKRDSAHYLVCKKILTCGSTLGEVGPGSAFGTIIWVSDTIRKSDGDFL